MFWYLELWKRRKVPAMVRKPAQKADWRKYWWWHAGSRASINTLPVHLCTNIIHWNALRKCWWVCRIRRLVCMSAITSAYFVLIRLTADYDLWKNSDFDSQYYEWISVQYMDSLQYDRRFTIELKERMSLDYISKLWTYRHTIFTHHI